MEIFYNGLIDLHVPWNTVFGVALSFPGSCSFDFRQWLQLQARSYVQARGGSSSSFVQILVLIDLYFLKCTKFDQLILRKIVKIVATRCQILTLKCTKIDFGWGSAPDPAGGAYSAPPGP